MHIEKTKKKIPPSKIDIFLHPRQGVNRSINFFVALINFYSPWNHQKTYLKTIRNF